MRLLYLYSELKPARLRFSDSSDLEFCFSHFREINTIDFLCWDIVFIDEVKMISEVEKFNIHATPVIFCQLDHLEILRYPFNHLFKIILFNPLPLRPLSGLPSSLYLSYWLFDKLPVKDSVAKIPANPRLLHIPCMRDTELYPTVELIKIFNLFPQYELTIVTGWQTKYLESISNPNVKIIDAGNGQNHEVDSDILLGSEEIALEGIMRQIPVIVIGIRGFGGIVNKDNLHMFYRSRFEGRIGAELREYIPGKFIIHEIETLKEKDVLQMVQETKREAEKYISVNVPKQHLLQHLKEVVTLRKSFETQSETQNIKPLLSMQVSIIPIENSALIKNMETNKLYGTVDAESAKWLMQMDGKKTVGELMPDNNPIKKSEYFEFVQELWQEKIITFIL